MGAAKKLIDKKTLRDLVPINALSSVHIEELSKKAIIEDIRSGRYLFKKGDRDYQSVYLLEGTVELVGNGREVVGSVRAGSDAARHPLAHKQPRQLSVRASGKVTIARIDSSLLDVLLTWDESAGYDVVEIDAQDDDDWMTRMLQSQAFLQLPPSNIHQLLMRLEAVSVKAGDVVVRQGEEGDYFYIVKSGRLAVTRKASARTKEVLLAELGDGACFGEDALVSGTRRNASVMMITDGSLMRLSKDDFNELLRTPMVHEIDFDTASKRVADGARWLDVRLPGEFDNQSIKGSTNLPLSALRDQCSELDSSTSYIVCCDTGRRSAAGAFLLSQRGLDVYTLKNGLMDVPESELAGERPAGSAPATDADIIPFDAESRPANKAAPKQDADNSEPQPADTALIDKLAATENEKIALQQQLDKLTRELGEAKARLQEVQAKNADEASIVSKAKKEIDDLKTALRVRDQQIEDQVRGNDEDRASLQKELDNARQTARESEQRLAALESEKQAVQGELASLQTSLEQARASANDQDDALRKELEQLTQRLAEQQQEYDKQQREREQALEQVRDDYQQLGQRTSAVAGERDAALKDLEKTQQEMAALQAQLESQQGDAGQQLEALQQALEQATQQLDEEKQQREGLQQQLDSLEQARAELEQSMASVSERNASEQEKTAELESQVAAGEQQIQQHEQALQQAGERETALQAQLAELQQQSGTELEQARSEFAAEKDELQQKFAALEAQLAERDTQAEQYQSQQEALAQQLEAAQQALDEANQREAQHAQAQAQDSEKVSQLEQELEQSAGAAEALRKQLDEAQQQRTDADRRAADLEAKLQQVEQGHHSDIASVREAMSRAQDERDNVQREHSRLTKSLQKAERELERARHDHEIEVHRLQKELKDSAGDSGSALASELEALQAQLQEAAKLRDDLEVKLGDRGAQLDASKTEVNRLSNQLQQANDSARQAEQQLIEATQAANEEMTVRLDAEQQAQQALREELEQVSAERNASQEQLTVQVQELEELRAAIQQAQAEAAAGADSARALGEVEAQLQELRDSVQALEQARDTAQQSEQQARQELDQLRAEAEVTRSLVDMQPSGDAGPAADEQLEQARKNVDVAVRLRSQAEAQVDELRLEVERLHQALDRAGATAEVELPAGHIPSLDENDPHASALLNPEFDQLDDDEPLPAAGTVLLEDETPAMADVPAAASSQGGGWKGLLVGLLVGGVLAGGAVWWFGRTVQDVPVPVAPAAPAARSEAKQPAPVVKPSRPAVVTKKKDSKPAKKAQPVAKGMPVFREPAWAKPAAAPEPQTAADDVEAAQVKEAPAPVVKTVSQPLRTFSESLSDGGRTPAMVAFRADRFQMGSGVASPQFDERPRHPVTLKSFAISKYEVTFSQYDRFAEVTGRARPADEGWGRGERPVINVSWQDAVAYTRWLSEQTGNRYRLPTEAEWEFAARSGSDKRFWWGNEVGEAHANCFDCGSQWSGTETAPVGSFTASRYGVSDMAGNVMEWVQDCYSASYADAPQDGSAVESDGCTARVVRGGGYSSPAESLRSAGRDQRAPQAWLDNLGFRVARDY